MARLRMDSHAQWEIQQYARAMYELAKPYFPISCEAFEDYIQQSVKVSRYEYYLLKRLVDRNEWNNIEEDFRNDDGICEAWGLSKRELEDFKKTWL
jgi:thymidylate synthase ThyX